MLSKPDCLCTGSDSLLQLKMPGNGTPLLCTKNPDHKQINKIKLLSWKQLRGIWKKDAQETQAENSDPESLLLAVPTPLPASCFLEQTLLLIPCAELL